MAGNAEKPEFSDQDVIEHVVTYGLDLFPPVDLPMETVRAQSLYSELHDRWPTLYESVTIGPEFRITTTLNFKDGAKASGFSTLIVNNRGPVFAFPNCLGAVRGQAPLNMKDIDPEQVFTEAYDLFAKTFQARQALRLGVVRQLTFLTGQIDCTKWLGGRVLEFDAAKLDGAQCLLAYKDDEYNYRIQMTSATIAEQKAVPILGQVPTGNTQFGLVVNFDVNNSQPRALDAVGIQTVIEKAASLWPGGLLAFLNGGSFDDDDSD